MPTTTTSLVGSVGTAQEFGTFGARVDNYAALKDCLLARYGHPEADYFLDAQLVRLERAFPNPALIAGLRLLDLGCGATGGSSETRMSRGSWAPWLCRAFDFLGGKAVGVDLGYASADDTFEFLRKDLRRADALEGFAPGSFDVVNCSNLLSSPHLVYGLQADREFRGLMGVRLRANLGTLMKPGTGIMLDFDDRLDNH